MQENKPLLIVGLGNPGAEYARTRHNVGFIALDDMAGDDVIWRTEHNAKTAHGKIGARRVILAKPQTFMNASGDAVGALARFYKIPPENIIVIHDDMDLPIGTLRVKIGGGSAGHNGIKSIDAAVGREYVRIRVGIGHPRNLGLQISPADWVLGRFTPEQYTEIEKAVHDIDVIKMYARAIGHPIQ